MGRVGPNGPTIVSGGNFSKGAPVMNGIVPNELPHVGEVLKMPAEELGILILQRLDKERSSNHNLWNFANSPLIAEWARRDGVDRLVLQRALAEGWAWLENQGFLAPSPDQASGCWRFITRRGRDLLQSRHPRAWVTGGLLPPEVLHPRLVEKARPPFLRGDYETAVFTAFKEVEVYVREAAGLGNDMIGVRLMRVAFSPDGGPLTDPGSESAEKEAMAHLFAGAIGLFKNPTSHRHIELSHPNEAAELILFANYLMRLVEQALERRSSKSGG